MKTLTLLFVYSVFATGCADLEVTLLTSPAPGQVADIDQEAGTISLSRGSAGAFECTDDRGRACSNLEVISDDEAIVATYRAHAEGLVSYYTSGDRGQSGRSAFLLVGTGPGKTSLEVIGGGESRDFTVLVVE